MINTLFSFLSVLIILESTLLLILGLFNRNLTLHYGSLMLIDLIIHICIGHF